MSLVGTRPPTVDEWDKYELHHRARLATKPGLTGMWQVSGRSNITDLSLSELGVGTAITYALYAPIARRDIKKQQILMRMFRNFYRITAGFVLLAGLCLIPFLDILMKDRPDVNHLIIIYLLYLLNSVVSYLLIYKKTLVDAHQMNYITVMYHNGFLVLQDIGE